MVSLTKGLVSLTKGLVSLTKGLVSLTKGLVSLTKGLVNADQADSAKKRLRRGDAPETRVSRRGDPGWQSGAPGMRRRRQAYEHKAAQGSAAPGGGLDCVVFDRRAPSCALDDLWLRLGSGDRVPGPNG